MNSLKRERAEGVEEGTDCNMKSFHDLALVSKELSIAVKGCKLCQGCTIFLMHENEGGKELEERGEGP